MLADKIISHFPKHNAYAEIFGGSLAVLFAKTPARVEIVNDIDSDIWNFWDVVRRHGRELANRLYLTPYSREEMQRCNQLAKTEADPIEKARIFFVRTMQSVNGYVGHGWSRHFNSSRSETFYRAVAAMQTEAIQRLQKVQLENRDFRKLIPELNEPSVLMFLDPPYVIEERRSQADAYDHEMTLDDHRELLSIINASRSMIVLSGYRSELYDNELSHWMRVDYEVPVRAQLPHDGKQVEKAIESIWLNPAAVAARSQ